MNKNKGFTLTELLAVIAILSALLLIVVPIVTDQVDISKQKAFESSVEAVKRAVLYYMDQKELTGENNEYIYNIDVEDLKISNEDTLKGQVIVTKTETGYDIKYNGITNGQFTYYGDSENGTIYNESDIKKDENINSSNSVVFENTDPILISNDEDIVVDDCYKNIIVKSNLTELEKSLSVIGGELEMVPNSVGNYVYGAKVKLLKNGEAVDAYDIIIAHGKMSAADIELEFYSIHSFEVMYAHNCMFPENYGYKIAKSCHENGLTKEEDLFCLYADFDYNRIITDDERQKVLGYFNTANGCNVDPIAGLNSCGK